MVYSSCRKSIMDGLSVREKNHPKIFAAGFINSGPSPNPAIRLYMLPLRMINDIQNPFVFDYRSVWPFFQRIEIFRGFHALNPYAK